MDRKVFFGRSNLFGAIICSIVLGFVFFACILFMGSAAGHVSADMVTPGVCSYVRKSPETVKNLVAAHEAWLQQVPGVSGRRLVLCGSDLSGGYDFKEADLRRAVLLKVDMSGANLVGARLDGADLSGSILRKALMRGIRGDSIILDDCDLEGAKLFDAILVNASLIRAKFYDADLREATLYNAVAKSGDFELADFTGANLQKVVFDGANLADADLRATSTRDASFQGARMTGANLTGAIFEPAIAPGPEYLNSMKGIGTVTYAPGKNSGLFQLRLRLSSNGLDQLAREATYALERQKTKHMMTDGDMIDVGDLAAYFRYAVFDITVSYGLAPWRALVGLILLVPIFALLYAIFIFFGWGNLYLYFPFGSIDADSEGAPITCDVPSASSIDGSTTYRKLGYALYFSIISAFYIGWRDFSVGTWVMRLHIAEYTLRSLGWIRVLSGVQSLFSVFLLAIFIASYLNQLF